MKWTYKPELDTLAWIFPPTTRRDLASWDDYGRKQFEHKLMTVGLADMMNDPDRVIAGMRANGLRTVLAVNPRTKYA